MSGSPKYADVRMSPSLQARLDELVGQGTSALDQILEGLQSTGLAGRRSSSKEGRGRIASSATNLIQFAERRGFRDVGKRIRGIVEKVKRPGLAESKRQSLTANHAASAIRGEASQLRQRIKGDERAKLILETVAQAASEMGYSSSVSTSQDGMIKLQLTGQSGAMSGSVREGEGVAKLVWEIDTLDSVEEVVDGRIVLSCPNTEEALEAIHERARGRGIDVGSLEWDGKPERAGERGHVGRESQRRTPKRGG